MHELERAVAHHYGKAGLLEAILAGLKRTGADPDNLQPADLAAVDEFHTAGRATTLKALEVMPLRAGMHLLDAGCGIGGTARVLAREHGCRVTGIDLTPQFVEVARALSERMGLADQCDFHVGSVTEMPFADAAFDATVMKGPSPGMIYPVPWAKTEETSFLKSGAETKDLLRDGGFRVGKEESLREFAIQYFRAIFAKAADASGPPPLGLHLLTGANAPEKFANYAKALEAHQIDPVILIAFRN